MTTKRQFLQTASALSVSAWLNNASAASVLMKGSGWFMPEESMPHQRTWMAFAANPKIWGEKRVPEVQKNLATIARTIAIYEPVTLLVNEADYELAGNLCGPSVDLLICPLDDLWIRDTGAVFLIDTSGKSAGISFNFNGWGNKQQHLNDKRVADFILKQGPTQRLNTRLVLEGGALEVDGRGTAIITESCVLNENRNPGLRKSVCEAELKSLLGLRKIIWLPGIAGHEITDGHTDFYARFTEPGVVVVGFDPEPDSFDHAVTNAHIEILQSATDCEGRRLQVHIIEAPKNVRTKFETKDFAAGYINFYVINGAVIAPQFGDPKADSKARETMRRLYPGREVIQLDIDALAAGGGGIHCVTLQEPRI